MDVAARLDAVEEDNARLRERIAELEGALGMDLLPPIEWRLTGAEARVLGVLLVRATATKDAVMAALYRDQAKDEAEIKIVDVFICKIRGKLKPFGIEIVTRWGIGYELTAESKAIVRAAIVEGGAPAFSPPVPVPAKPTPPPPIPRAIQPRRRAPTLAARPAPIIEDEDELDDEPEPAPLSRGDLRLVAACLKTGGLPRAVLLPGGRSVWLGPDDRPWRQGVPLEAPR